MEERNVVSWTALIAGYDQGNRACEVVEIFRRIRVDGVKPDEVTMVAMLSAFIDMYAKSGSIQNVMDVFENMKDRCVITWTTVIAGLALHGKEALEIFSRMEKSHFKPNDVTLIAVLSACSHSGLVEPGRWYFSNLLLRYGIKPRIEHYGCMIDLLASRLYGNIELGENAFEELVKLEHHNSGKAEDGAAAAKVLC
ncbi:pentatricopeptide repeat-containing protein [Tanacetum coccineum]